MTTPRTHTGGGEPQPTKMRFLFTLLTWLFIGPAGMILTLMSIVQRGTGWTTGHDALFFAFLFAAVGARWIDYFNGDPVTSGGEGATPGAARRYTILVVSLGVVSWVMGNAIGNHVLR
jgi:hypothetical protein